MRLHQIAEGRDAPLYHGAPMPALLAILFQSNTLDKGIHWGRPGEPDGARLTRSMKVARNFAEEQDYPGGVLAFSQTKLAQNYRITPYRDTDASGEYWSDEAEEVVIGDGIDPVSRYLVAIYLDPDLILGTYREMDWFRENDPTGEQFQNSNWALFSGPDEIEGYVEQLSRHPLLQGIDGFMSRHGPR